MIPIHERLLAINAEQSARYVADETARKRYWAKYPTFFACIKCMDGRINFPLMTKTPTGIVKPFRAIGGQFETWWPSFLGRVRHWTEKAMKIGSRNFVFITYHFSASDEHLGCAGWKYDTKSARAHAEKLQQELSYIFGEQMTTVVAGAETDQDNLTLHGPNGDVSGKMLIGNSHDEIKDILTESFPLISAQTIHDLIPFLIGNASRVDELIRLPRQIAQKQHGERIIAVGQGFDWLASENLALIINDADPNLAESIKVAASIIEKNLANTESGDDATIFTSIPYREPGIDYRQAVMRAKGLRAFAEKVIQQNCPQLAQSGRLHSLSAVMWEPNKKTEVIE